MNTAPNLMDAINVADAAKRLRASEPSVYRWITAGVVIPGRGRVRLGAVRIGGHYLITPDAIDLFVIACNPTATATAPVESPAAIERRGKEAQRRLAERLGGAR